MYNPEGYVFGKFVEAGATIDILKGVSSSKLLAASVPEK